MGHKKSWCKSCFWKSALPRTELICCSFGFAHVWINGKTKTVLTKIIYQVDRIFKPWFWGLDIVPPYRFSKWKGGQSRIQAWKRSSIGNQLFWEVLPDQDRKFCPCVFNSLHTCRMQDWVGKWFDPSMWVPWLTVRCRNRRGNKRTCYQTFKRAWLCDGYEKGAMDYKV